MRLKIPSEWFDLGVLEVTCPQTGSILFQRFFSRITIGGFGERRGFVQSIGFQTGARWHVDRVQPWLSAVGFPERRINSNKLANRMRRFKDEVTEEAGVARCQPARQSRCAGAPGGKD